MTRPTLSVVRSARTSDVAFLVDAVIAAEKSGTDKLSFSTLFDLTEAETRETLSRILAEDIAGQELALSGFMISEVDGRPVAAMSSWLEGATGRPSGVIKANLLLHFVGRERFVAAASRLAKVNLIALHRTPGALQLDCVYVAPGFRGAGLVGLLADAHIDRAQRFGPRVSQAQIVLMGGNEGALRAYLKAGFAVTEERSASDPELARLLPSSTRVLMTRTLACEGKPEDAGADGL